MVVPKIRCNKSKVTTKGSMFVFCKNTCRLPADYLSFLKFKASIWSPVWLFVYCRLVLIFVLGGFIDYFSIFCSASSMMIDVLEFLSVGSMRILQRKPEQLRFSYTLAFASVQLSLHSRSSAVPNLNYDLPWFACQPIPKWHNSLASARLLLPRWRPSYVNT